MPTSSPEEIRVARLLDVAILPNGEDLNGLEA